MVSITIQLTESETPEGTAIRIEKDSDLEQGTMKEKVLGSLISTALGITIKKIISTFMEEQTNASDKN